MKITWEEILPKYFCKGMEYDEYNTAIDSAIERLKQAEREENVCLNPPNENEIAIILIENGIYSSTKTTKDISHAIYNRIMGK